MNFATQDDFHGSSILEEEAEFDRFFSEESFFALLRFGEWVHIYGKYVFELLHHCFYFGSNVGILFTQKYICNGLIICSIIII